MAWFRFSPRSIAILAAAVLGLAWYASGPAARAESPSPALGNGSAGQAVATPDKMRQLLELLEDPEVRAVLERRKAVPSSDTAPTQQAPNSMAGSLGNELQDLRDHIRSLAIATPHLPEEFETARSMLVTAIGRHELVKLGLFLAAFVALGFGGELLFRRSTTRWRVWLLGLRLDTTRQRVEAVFARLGYGLGIILSYALGSVGAVLLFDWTILLKQILLGYLIASVFVRLAFVFGRFFLAPGAERFRVAPMSTPAASFLFHRLGLVAILLAFGSQTITLLGSFGFSPIAREISAYTLGLAVLVLALETLWRFPHHDAPETRAEGAEDRPTAGRRLRRLPLSLGLSVAFVLLGGLWVAQATTVFWLIAFAIGLPAAIALTQRSVRHVLRPPEAAHSDDADAHRLEVIFFERGIRSLLIVVAALLLGRLLGIDFASLTMQDTITTRILRGVLGVVIVVLVADFLWHALTALVDRRLAGNLAHGAASEETGHAARLHTLLPILKNLMLAVLLVIAFMMALAAMGIQIGPLIASAGVVGVAIGFGAQTLVKDIISGIFYLIDDAFRIGEYIQSGTYKGTVESFSLRSVKLRHQRGALYTVPFGILGAVQNQSRDWVVDKITINVPYGTDLEKVRKLVKRIGETLADDPELGPEILKPLKMQGVTNFGDYAIQINTKMMTKPGDVQFAARRRALVMIKQAFEANDIGFALPMVHVSGGEGKEASVAAAQRGLALVSGGKVDEAV